MDANELLFPVLQGNEIITFNKVIAASLQPPGQGKSTAVELVGQRNPKTVVQGQSQLIISNRAGLMEGTDVEQWHRGIVKAKRERVRVLLHIIAAGQDDTVPEIPLIG